MLQPWLISFVGCGGWDSVEVWEVGGVDGGVPQFSFFGAVP